MTTTIDTHHAWTIETHPADPTSRDRHYRLRAICTCGWASRIYQYWGQANTAWAKHRDTP